MLNVETLTCSRMQSMETELYPIYGEKNDELLTFLTYSAVEQRRRHFVSKVLAHPSN